LKLEDFRRLKKLMNMTLSGADQEKLTAINSANEIIRKSDTTWDRVLDRVIKVEVEIEPRDAKTEPSAEAVRKAAFAKVVDDMFETVLSKDPRGEANDFIASIKDQWDRNGRLSRAQFEGLEKFAKRAEGRA